MEFKNPIEPKERKTSKDFKAPTKEGATTGRFMSAGDDYGIGFINPVGKEKASGMESGPIPMKSKCLNPDDINFKD